MIHQSPVEARLLDLGVTSGPSLEGSALHVMLRCHQPKGLNHF